MATMAENIIAVGSETRNAIVRDQILADLPAQEKLRYDSDIKDVNILLLGLPVDIYNFINHYRTVKEI
ncbi:hypothetical protein Tco_1272048 [Tanacetum coccineum]